MRWQEFETAAPELAALARDRFAATDLVMLGTLRNNGWPRITPVEYSIFEGDFLVGGMWQSQKCRDLLRDPRCVIHSTTSNKNGQEGDVKLYGRALAVPEPEQEPFWRHLEEATGWRPDGPAHLFRVDIESGAYVRFEGDGVMHWLTFPGNEWRARKA